MDEYTCPFCKTGEFDLLGLALHYRRFGCQEMDSIDLDGREEKPERDYAAIRGMYGYGPEHS